MKKQYFLALTFLLLSATIKAQNPMSFTRLNGPAKNNRFVKPEEVQKMPTFQFVEKENTHDFGPIPEGPKVTYVFTFTNTGTAPLIITNAQASCGCTSPEFPKEPILPKQKGKITVTYTTEGHPGNFNKSVYLSSNASNNNADGRFELFIKGVVIAAQK